MMPENGALIALRLSVACSLAKSDWDLLKAAWASSTATVVADPALREGLGAVQGLLAHGEVRLNAKLVSALDGIVNLHEHLAGRHTLIGLEHDRVDDAAELDRDVGPLGGADGAEGIDCRLPRHRHDVSHRDDDGGPLHAREKALDRLGAEHVEADEATADERNEDERENESLDHGESRKPISARRRSADRASRQAFAHGSTEELNIRQST